MSQVAPECYTAGKTNKYGRVPVDLDVLDAVKFRSVRDRLTTTEIVHRILCREFNLNPAKPSERLPSKRTRVVTSR